MYASSNARLPFAESRLAFATLVQNIIQVIWFVIQHVYPRVGFLHPLFANPHCLQEHDPILVVQRGGQAAAQLIPPSHSRVSQLHTAHASLNAHRSGMEEY
jgi:hypothetical protein